MDSLDTLNVVLCGKAYDANVNVPKWGSLYADKQVIIRSNNHAISIAGLDKNGSSLWVFNHYVNIVNPDNDVNSIYITNKSEPLANVTLTFLGHV